jgi:hypothetical protein
MRNQIISTLTAVVLGLSIGMPAMATSYADDANIAEWSKESVDILTELGVLSGYPDGSFQPQWSINREEYAVSLLNGLSVLEGLVTEAYTANDTYLYEELVNQQVMLLDALAAIDEIKAKDAVEKNNFVGISLNYNTETSTSSDNGSMSVDGKLQVIKLSDTFAVSVRPFLNDSGEAGAAITVDAGLTDKLTVSAGTGAAASWSANGILTGGDDVVGYGTGVVQYDVSKNGSVYTQVKVPFTGPNSGDVNVGLGYAVKF